MTRRVSSPVLVGRGPELRRLRELLTTGEPAIVLIGGDAGVGKTRLVDTFVEAARADGARVLAGACADFGEGGPPFAPVVDALRGLLRERGGASLQQLLGPARHQLARLLPGLGDPASAAPVTDPQATGVLFASVAAALERLAADRPLVVILEDLHWADRSTLGVLSYLARSLASGPLLLVGTYRTDDLHRRHHLRPVVAELSRLQRVERIDLAPLTPAETAELVTAILGGPPEPDVLRAVVDRTDGNAFYAEELLAACAVAPDEPLPRALRDVLAARLDPLGAEVRHVLAVAGAAGRVAGHELLAACSGLAGDGLAASLRTAVDHQVLVPEGAGYRFRHALVREAVLDDLLPGERSELHRTLAEALEARPDLLEGDGRIEAEIAHHWFAAHATDRAFTWAARAAERSLDLYAYPEALAQAERALALWSEVDPAVRSGHDRTGLFRTAMQAAVGAGDARRGAALGRAMLASLADAGTTVERATATVDVSRAIWQGGDAPAALDLAAAAVRILDELGPSPERAAALAYHSRLLMLAGHAAEAVAPGREALELARRYGAAVAEIEALNSVGCALVVVGEVQEGEALLAEAVAVAREAVPFRADAGREAAGAFQARGAAYNNLLSHLVQAARFEEALELHREVADWLGAGAGSHAGTAWLTTNTADCLTWLGRPAEAAALLDAIPHHHLTGWTAVVVHHSRAAAALRRGDLDAAARQLEAAAAAASESHGDDGQFTGSHLELSAELAAWRGDLAAVHDADDRSRAALAGTDYEIRRPLTIAHVVRATVDAGGGVDDLLAEAAALGHRYRGRLAHGEPLVSRLALPWCAAEASRTDPEAAVARWAALIDGFPARLRWHEAYARWRRAEALLALGRADEAAAELRTAHAAASEGGAQGLRAAIETLARRARVDLGIVVVRDGGVAVLPRLTPREREVLALVAEGRTNREIGAVLFISEKTASVHVSNILAKLGVENRVEAAGVALRDGLTPA